MLLDVFGADSEFGERSRRALRDARAAGALVACEVVWAEVAAAFPDRASANVAMDRLGIAFSAATVMSAIEAGAGWRADRRGGGSRERVVADFLIAAHATLVADRLLSRDRGFYRSRFSQLTVLDPSAG